MNQTEYAMKELKEWKTKYYFQYEQIMKYVNPAEAWWLVQDVLPKAGMTTAEFNNMLALLKYIDD